MRSPILRVAPLALLTSLSFAQSEGGSAEGHDDLWKAIESGRTWIDLRHRYEFADIDGFANDADASTLRTALGYETGRYKGFRGLLEFEAISIIGDNNFNSTTNGVTDHPVVADPEGSEINQVYVAYDGFEGVDVRLGRQEISLDNDRFIGAVPWRQNHQSFDGLRVIAKDVGGVKIDYSAVSNVNRIFGDRSARGNELLNGHFANVSTDLGSVGRGTVYGYLVDFNDTQVLSTNTFGARVVGKHDVGSGKVGYVVEAAQQTDAFSNPVDVDADYLHLELNGSIEKFNVRIASETLGGSGDVGDKFSTPFATLHAFNGFADVFLNTPDGGLVDQFVTVSRPIAVGGLPGPIKLRASYHVFTSDAGSLDYGTELDLDAVIPLTDRAKLGLRYADFDADDAFADTTRFMAWLHVRVL